MSTNHLVLRRLATIIGVIAVMALGYGSIKAASAWTAASAPLTVAPVSVSVLKSSLADEQARSKALAAQLQDLDASSRDLETALAQAKDRVVADSGQAGDLEDQLDAASKKLAKLEAAILKAKKALAAQVAAAARQTRTASAGSSTSRSHDGEDEHEDEHEDDGD